MQESSLIKTLNFYKISQIINKHTNYKILLSTQNASHKLTKH